jgi:ribonuclease HII
LLQFERQAWGRGISRLAGVDEAGRGPLAGPVVAAAVAFERAFLEAEQYGTLKVVNDSKCLTPRERDSAYSLITESPFCTYGVGIADVDEIDSLNILRATHLAMARAVSAVAPLPEFVLVDGLPVPDLPCASLAIVQGDSRSLSVAAASIIAKVTRDRIMVVLDQQYPQYSFCRHKGYGTRVHMKALLEYGPCPVHRRSFRPVQEMFRLHGAGDDVASTGAK